MSKVQNRSTLVGLALFNTGIQKPSHPSGTKVLKRGLKTFTQCPSETFRVNKDHVDSKNFADLIKESPFVKYPVKIVSTLDIPHRYVNLRPLELHSTEPDRSVSPGLSSDMSDDETCPSTGDLDLPLKSILKKPQKSRFATPKLFKEANKIKKTLRFAAI